MRERICNNCGRSYRRPFPRNRGLCPLCQYEGADEAEREQLYRIAMNHHKGCIVAFALSGGRSDDIYAIA